LASLQFLNIYIALKIAEIEDEFILIVWPQIILIGTDNSDNIVTE